MCLLADPDPQINKSYLRLIEFKNEHGCTNHKSKGTMMSVANGQFGIEVRARQGILERSRMSRSRVEDEKLSK